jgi:biotin operon repressor
MEADEVEALGRAIEAHVTWLRQRGVQVESDAADLTLTETVRLLQRSGEQWNAREARC